MEVPSDTQVYSDIVFSTITINATPFTAGNYACVAENIFNVDIEQLRIDVQGTLYYSLISINFVNVCSSS